MVRSCSRLLKLQDISWETPLLKPGQLIVGEPPNLGWFWLPDVSTRSMCVSSIPQKKGKNMIQMGVSKNNGIPKSSIFIEFSIINHPFCGTPIFGNIQMISSYWISPISLVFRYDLQQPPSLGRCKLLWDGRLRSCPECGATLAEEVLKVGPETAMKPWRNGIRFFFWGCKMSRLFFSGKNWKRVKLLNCYIYIYCIIYISYNHICVQSPLP